MSALEFYVKGKYASAKKAKINKFSDKDWDNSPMMVP